MTLENDIPVGDIATHRLIPQSEVEEYHVIIAQPGQEYIHTTPKRYGSDKKVHTQDTVPENKFYVEETEAV